MVETRNVNMLNMSHRWELGSCSGTASYVFNYTYVKYERCCLIPGNHTLSCHNDKGPFGWGNSFIEIQGKRYCDDFVGFQAMRKVSITNKSKNYK